MAKFHGAIGYTEVVETSPGVYKHVSEEIPCQGDVLRDNRRWESTDNLNDDVTINNRFSVVANSFIKSKMSVIRYLVWAGIKWKVTSIEVEPPRIIFTVRGVWNGNQT